MNFTRSSSIPISTAPSSSSSSVIQRQMSLGNSPGSGVMSPGGASSPSTPKIMIKPFKGNQCCFVCGVCVCVWKYQCEKEKKKKTIDIYMTCVMRRHNYYFCGTRCARTSCLFFFSLFVNASSLLLKWGFMIDREMINRSSISDGYVFTLNIP